MRQLILGTFFMRIFVFVLGLIVILPAVNKLYSYCTYRYRGEMVYGIITHPAFSRDLGGRPLIQYTDAKGGVHEFKSRAKTHWFYAPKNGEKSKYFTTGTIRGRRLLIACSIISFCL